MRGLACVGYLGQYLGQHDRKLGSRIWAGEVADVGRLATGNYGGVHADMTVWPSIIAGQTPLRLISGSDVTIVAYRTQTNIKL